MARSRWLVAAVLAGFLGTALAAGPGDLDPAFNGGQPVVLAVANELDDAQPDGAGRIVAAGNVADPDGNVAVAIVRLGPDGALDPTFAAGGTLVTQAGRGGGMIFSLARSIAPRAGGAGWVVTGGASASDGRQAALALAIDANGALDLGFGSGGSARIQAAGPSPALTLAFAGDGAGGLAADGTLVMAHTIAPMMGDTADEQLALLKVGADGQPVTGFATNGVYVHSFSASATQSFTNGAAALPTADGILVAGSTLDGSGRDALLLVRLTADGLLDGGFAGGTGYRLVQAGAGATPFSDGWAVATSADGIYVAGDATDADGNAAVALARFTAAGDRDLGYGTSGIARFQVASGDAGTLPNSYARAVAVQPDGKVLLVGSSGTVGYAELVVLRVDTTGNLDPSFGSGGVVRLQPATGTGERTLGFSARVTPDGGAVVVAGITFSDGTPRRGFVTRILLATPTTTTVPAGCAADATIAAALCRLDALRAQVDAAVPAGRFHDHGARTLAAAEQRVQQGASLGGKRRSRKLGGAITLVRRFARQMRTRTARKLLGADLGGQLAADADGVTALLKQLR